MAIETFAARAMMLVDLESTIKGCIFFGKELRETHAQEGEGKRGQ